MSSSGNPRLRSAAASGGLRGCAASVVAAPALLVLAPAAAVIRGWQGWRRGADWRIEIERIPRGRDRARLDVTADIPRAAESGFVRRATHSLIRIAETLRRPDDVYHLYYRVPGDDDGVLLPVGPRLQELGERLSLSFGQSALEGRTTLWLTLPANRPAADHVDPSRDDPEAPGKLEELIARPGTRWAMAVRRTHLIPSTVHRIMLWLPDESAETVVRILRDLHP